MNLRELAKQLNDCRLIGGAGPEGLAEITSAELDSRACKPGCIFACVKGYLQDGHKYAEKALEAGAAALISDSPETLRNISRNWAEGGQEIPENISEAAAAGNTGKKLKIFRNGKPVPVFYAKDTRKTFAEICAILAGKPSETVNVVGITGTKGKTTTSYMMRSILAAAGKKSGLIGTICNFVGDRQIETERTTPEANVIQPLFREMADEGIDTCIMEVSSQGLHMHRVYAMQFSTAVFTNLSRDHIGPSEHANMEEYAAAKAMLYSMSRNALINADNDWSEFMLDRARASVSGKVYTYDLNEGVSFQAANVRKFPEHVEFDCIEKFEPGKTGKQAVRVPIPGKFTVYNALAAYGAMRLEGIDAKTCAEGLAKVFVAGKAEVVPTGRDFTVIIDYAHNPDSFINILTTVKEFAKRTVFLFGCGGDRNRPRALMGETAGKYADFSIITSDNPRSEDPASIVADLEAGLKPTGGQYVAIVDRREAIKYAITHALPGDVIILAGKGHETYQILKDRTIHFDEREVVREVLAEMEKNGK